MSQVTAHIINHTHWDREWFLTSVYTSRWIPGLIDRLEQLVAGNPDFRYLFDGQTLVIEDLLAVAPDYAERVRALIAAGKLVVGPYYCQPDWQLAGGELLIRNLELGQQDVVRWGGAMRTGWLVDTFGHISQAPQLHRLFDIDAVYVWRGVPQLAPYFCWRGADGSKLFTIDLFGGYRNLYGVTHAPEVAVRRLHAEIDKLRPFYPTPDIPLFDGYDLEDNPEDPLRFFAQAGGLDPKVQLREATPFSFAQEMAAHDLELPEIVGELNSGKYGATFPGTFSARTYLKLMAWDCEHLLFQRVEPLATMAWLKGRPYPAVQIEGWTRALLQNAVHDCICGVSIDEVHDKMAHSYRQLFAALVDEMQDALTIVLGDFAPGWYAVGTSPFPVDQWQTVGDELIHVRTDGAGVWPIGERIPVMRDTGASDQFTWRNEHFVATVDGTGSVHVGDAVYGRLAVYAEHGDTYSDERGAHLGVLQVRGPLTIEEVSAHHSVVRFAAGWAEGERRVDAVVRLRFDLSALIRWEVELDSGGTDLAVEMDFQTAIELGAEGRVGAGMPFDVVTRPVADTDLLPRTVKPELASILLGQRELDAVTTFPFHNFVAVTDGRRTVAVLARGLHAYAANAEGGVQLPLRRAVEWLTRADLRNRVGDAGPFFYVPGARCERVERHELAVACGDFAPDSLTLQQINGAFQNPPLVVENLGRGDQTSWRLLQEDLPMSNLRVQGEGVVARFYNPTAEPVRLRQPRRQTDVWGAPGEELPAVGPKRVSPIRLDMMSASVRNMAATPTRLLTPPVWRVGLDVVLPKEEILAGLEDKIAELEAEAAALATQIAAAADGVARLRLQHRYYVVKRESVELRLSVLLNRRRLAAGGTLDGAALYEPDPEIAAVGLELNQLRIKRRIFDYVIAAL
jgi:alpha-mannosidase